jgi:multidrug efflux pump
VILLKPHGASHDPLTRLLDLLLGWFFTSFNWAFDRATAFYGRTVAVFLRLSVILLLVYGGLIGLTYLGFKAVPTGFIPQQDKGYLIVNAQLPEGASLERSEAVVSRMTEIARKTEGVAHAIRLPGYSVVTGSNLSNVGGMFVVLGPFEERAGHPELSADQVAGRLRQAFRASDVFDTLQIYLGSAYVNDITLFNRNWQVNVQADSRFRLRAEDVGKLKVRNAAGDMVPLGTMISVKDVAGPAIVNHYNSKPSAEVSGGTAPGVSSGQAIALMERVARQELPSGMGYEWTELTYQQIEAGKDLLTKLVFPLAVVFVFMVLAAQYESLSLPLAILLIVPMCLLAAIAGVWLARMDNNIFTQIGLVVLVGLASKNAILIVEFAKQLQDEGKGRFDATVEASKQRLRPILMTSFAFILGVVPLVLAKGAGAEMRVALGVAVFSGMLGVTVFGIFFTPVFYVVIRWLTERRAPAPSGASAIPPAAHKEMPTYAATEPGGGTGIQTSPPGPMG